MEKRAFIAILLSIIILLLYQSLFLKTPGEVSQKEKATPKKPLTKIPQEEVKTVPPLMPDRLKEAGKEEEAIVETDLYVAIFSSQGARLKSWQLKRYLKELKEDSESIDLIPSSKAGGFPQLQWLSENPFNDWELIYQASKNNIALTDANKAASLPFSASTRNGLNIKKEYFFHPNKYSIDLYITIANPSSQPVEGKLELVWRNWGVPQRNKDRFGFSGPVAFINNKLKEIPVKKLGTERVFSEGFRWAGFEDKYFLSAIIPRGEEKSLRFRRVENMVSAAISYPDIRIYPGKQASYQYTIYLGPKDIRFLREVGANLENALNFGWFDLLAKPLLFSLNFLNRYTHNYGVSIILLSIVIKILLFPLTHKSFKSMKDMQKIQPKVLQLREKLKDNREKLNREIMDLYRSNKVNPLGGCLPMLLQIPVFFAFYKVLFHSIEIRHAPFIWWIRDLSAPDTAFYVGSFPANILPLLMGITMFIQQKMTPTAVADPLQAKLMLFMPLIFLIILWNLPSGLVLYWTVTNVLSIGQQAYINKCTK